MRCQESIAEKIIDEGGDYTLAAIKRALVRLEEPGASSPPIQEQLFTCEEHPLIRPLSHYQALLGPEQTTNP